MSARYLHDELLDVRLDGSAQPHAALRDRLRDVLIAAEQDGTVFDMFETDWAAVPGIAEDELTAAPAHLLLAWCDDLDGCAFFVLPLDHEGASPMARLVADARMLRGVAFASASDCNPGQLGAAMRLLVAFGRRSPAQLHAGWRAEIDHAGGPARVGVASADDLVPFHTALAAARLRRPADLVHRVVEVVSVNKAS